MPHIECTASLTRGPALDTYVRLDMELSYIYQCYDECNEFVIQPQPLENGFVVRCLWAPEVRPAT